MTPGKLAVLAAAAALLIILEKKATAGSYFYDEEEVKRWNLGPGGRAGNCDICVDNADLGWIGMDDVFDSVDGPIDEAPAHPNCSCFVDFRTKKVRVYV
jgi:hypothetical protein